jgi:hypothetical protein
MIALRSAGQRLLYFGPAVVAGADLSARSASGHVLTPAAQRGDVRPGRDAPYERVQRVVDLAPPLPDLLIQVGAEPIGQGVRHGGLDRGVGVVEQPSGRPGRPFGMGNRVVQLGLVGPRLRQRFAGPPSGQVECVVLAPGLQT